MISVIVFSKDRPMQIHAYLESLFKFSDINHSDIVVLYCDSTKISYEKVIEQFPDVNWVKENEFKEQLWSLVHQSKQYIMFGCDDVVFRKQFESREMIKCLESDQEIWGYSLRLGMNIRPLPDAIEKNNEYCKWRWKETTCAHYNYPWEVDCTLYRKEDVLKIVDKYKDIMTNPNNFEGTVYLDLENNVTRPYLAMGEGEGKAIVITVNRVQDTALNAYDDREDFSAERLYEMYIEENERLDIVAISQKNTKCIHVGADFLIFSRRKRNDTITKKIIVYIKNLYRNFKFLCTHDLRREQEKMRNEAINKIRSEIKYGIVNESR